MRTVIRSAISAGAAGHRPAVLTGGIVAPASVAQAVRRIVIAGCTAISAIAFPAMLAAGVFLPRAVAIAVTAGVNRFRFTLAADTRIRTVTVAGAGCVALVVQHPCMAAAGRAGPGPIAAVAVLLVNVSAKIFYIMALITLVVLLMTSGCMRLLDVGALQRILLTAWAGADNAGGRTGGNLCRRFLDAACGGGICVLIHTVKIVEISVASIGCYPVIIVERHRRIRVSNLAFFAL